MNDDKKIWQEAIQDVVPIKSSHKANIKPPQKVLKKVNTPTEKISTTIHLYDNDIDQPEYMFFARAGLQHRVQHQLRTGKIKSEATLDLHGLTVEESRIAVSEFLTKTHARGFRTIKIIHGKGQTRGPVLRNKVYQWLPQCVFVLAFCSAIASDGGTGAVYILLRHKS
jgi:DNA-nicking Smr family endonuclease